VLNDITKTQHSPGLLLRYWIGYYEDSYNLGFLKLVKNLMPELKGLIARIGNFTPLPLVTSIANFEISHESCEILFLQSV